MPDAPLLLSRSDVARLLTIDECIAAVEQAFAAYGRGDAATPRVLEMLVEGGGFHTKAGFWRDDSQIDSFRVDRGDFLEARPAGCAMVDVEILA